MISLVSICCQRPGCKYEKGNVLSVVAAGGQAASGIIQKRLGIQAGLPEKTADIRMAHMGAALVFPKRT